MPPEYRFGDELGVNELGTLVDHACQEFTERWRAGDRPRIETFLEQSPPAVANAVLHQLLLLEVQLMESGGQAPDTRDWLVRFPQYESVLRHARRQIQETHIRSLDDTVLEAVSTSTRYSDLRLFRTGGMADLYLAHDFQLRRDTVVKRLREKFRNDPDYSKRLAIEAEITGRLNDPRRRASVWHRRGLGKPTILRHANDPWERTADSDQ